MKKVVAIVGPTAVGKSALGLELAEKFNAEIISGDSMQVYRKLDIGTAKDSKEELAKVPHHLVDILDVTEEYSVKQFQDQASQCIDELYSRNILPILVGGTGFYLNSLVEGMNFGGESKSSKEQRNQLNLILEEKGISALKDILREEDPEAYDQLDIQNPRRIIRAIEVKRITGKSILDQEEHKNDYEFLIIGLTDDRQELYESINSRVDKMMDLGLLSEAEYVYKNKESIPQAKNGIGYKEFFPYFDKTNSLENCVEEVKKNSRRFAKRQFTYFRNQMEEIIWFNVRGNPDFKEEIEEKIREFLGGNHG
ncbi:tRNA (adenosine(37)-N6)-dimethylallyltransferase MiaA [Companilactobacillus metriopterae]|uniref:tRNA (adenosine(37)-N6)-dimethylallyltransferase MiaA n=1 Tax=Companilactobacillus metriopterae TaxID=1909267 RepID=UPI00100B8C2A|nr:tRNA (adenosine(37)-N6)-dimethylallyltransferase MiaA [Companilactobacillus metriopterae]